MRWEVTTTATSLKLASRVFLVDAENRLQVMQAMRAVNEKVLRVEVTVDDEVTAARDRKAVMRAVKRHEIAAYPSPVEELMNGGSP